MTKYQGEDIENKVTQLRKGIVELAILSALRQSSHYGYSLVRLLTTAGAAEMKEGTIYPILGRLAKEGLVRSEWAESSQGPPRKYYALTEPGQLMCDALNGEFGRLMQLVEIAGRPVAAAAPESKKINIGRKEHD